MPYKTIAVVVLVLCLAGWALTMTLLSLLARRPDDLGVRDGRLAPCPGSPNCVCSCDSNPPHAIEPIRFDGSPDEAWLRLQKVVKDWPRTRIIQSTDTYLHAESVSRLFRFTDDVEFLLDPDGRRIHVRSASRTGRSDLGVNRARVEAIRSAFAEGKGGS